MYFFKATLILACTLVHIAIHQIRHSLSELQFFFPIWFFPFFYQIAKHTVILEYFKVHIF